MSCKTRCGKGLACADCHGLETTRRVSKRPKLHDGFVELTWKRRARREKKSDVPPNGKKRGRRRKDGRQQKQVSQQRFEIEDTDNDASDKDERSLRRKRRRTRKEDAQQEIIDRTQEVIQIESTDEEKSTVDDDAFMSAEEHPGSEKKLGHDASQNQIVTPSSTLHASDTGQENLVYSRTTGLDGIVGLPDAPLERNGNFAPEEVYMTMMFQSRMLQELSSRFKAHEDQCRPNQPQTSQLQSQKTNTERTFHATQRRAKIIIAGLCVTVSHMEKKSQITSELREKLVMAETELNSIWPSLIDKDAEIAGKQALITSLQALLLRHESDSNIMKLEIRNLKAQCAAHDDKDQSSTKRLQTLQQELSKAQTELQRYKDTEPNLQRQIYTAGCQIDDLKKVIEEKSDQLRDVYQKVENLEEEIKRISAQKKFLDKKAKDADIRLSDVRKEYKPQISQLKDRNEQLEKETESMDKQRKRVEKELRCKIEQLEIEKADEKREADRLRGENERLRLKVAGLKDEISEKGRQIKDLESENGEFQGEISKLRSSERKHGYDRTARAAPANGAFYYGQKPRQGFSSVV